MSKKSISLTQACEGMVRYKQATGKSENTIADYRVSFKKLLQYFESDPQFAAITRGEMIEFFAWLQEDYLAEPDGVAPRGKFKLSAKTVKNIDTNLSALWHWAVDEGFVKANIIRSIEPPPISDAVIEPFTKKTAWKPLASHRPDVLRERCGGNGVLDKANKCAKFSIA